MGAARRARRVVASAALVCACASPPGADLCPPVAERAPLPSAECFRSEEGQSHAVLLSTAISDALMGYVSHPGSAELTVFFGDDAGVGSLCVDSLVGREIARRLPRADRELRALPPGPACFAGRRLDFAWESPEVTHARVREAVRECRRGVESHRRKNLFCHETQRCPVEQVSERWDRADRELQSCVLTKIPLELHVAGSAEAHHFVPDQPVPDPELAARALEVCEALPDHAAVVRCMREYGWQPKP